MFTGITEATAKVLRKTESGLTLERPKGFDDIKKGSSLSVAGVCLSVVAFAKQSMSFEVVGETWSKTNLGELRAGDFVNLERALAAGGRFDGHMVQGHVEGVGKVVDLAGSIPSPPGPLPHGGRGSMDGGPFLKEKINPTILKFARSMRKKPTKAEGLLWDALRRHQLSGLLFRRQHPVGGRILDFYCHQLNLGIELDGPIHDTKTAKKYDQERSDYLLENRNISILRFSNEEIIHHLPSVLELLTKHIHTHSPPPRGEGVGEREQGVALTIDIPPSLLPFIVSQGSIAIDGVSLTVASLKKNLCTIALIPLTLTKTTLGTLRRGSCVNIETDIVMRAIYKRSKQNA